MTETNRQKAIKLLILGPGCYNCEKLETLCREVAETFAYPVAINKITDLSEIADHGVMMTPGLIINGKLVSAGRIPSKMEITQWLQEESNP